METVQTTTDLKYLGQLLGLLFDGLKRPIVIYDYTFSLYGLIIFVLVVGIIGGFVWDVLD